MQVAGGGVDVVQQRDDGLLCGMVQLMPPSLRLASSNAFGQILRRNGNADVVPHPDRRLRTAARAAPGSSMWPSGQPEQGMGGSFFGSESAKFVHGKQHDSVPRRSGVLKKSGWEMATTSGSSIAARALGGKAEHGKAHRDAVILVGFKRCAVRLCAAANDHAVIGFLNVHTGLGQLCDHRGDAVGFLTLSSLCIADNGFALRECRRDRDNGQLIDEARDDSAADLRRADGCILMVRSHIGSALIAEVRLGDVAPMSRRTSRTPCGSDSRRHS